MPSSRSGSPSTSGEHGAMREHAKQLKSDGSGNGIQSTRSSSWSGGRNVTRWKRSAANGRLPPHATMRTIRRSERETIENGGTTLARRRWDPPKKSKPNPLQSDPLQSDAPESDDEAREAAAAAQSLLFLQQYGKRNAVAANPSPLDARNSFPDEPPFGRAANLREEDEPSAKSGHGTSGRWAVLTPSTFSDGDGDGAVFYLFLPILSLSLRYGQIVNVLWSSPMATKFDACDRILVRHVPGPSTQEIHKKQSPGLATRG
ncbi:hypothetical protein B0H10DRAFT_1969389 [Mycena sp. CBHHK59/15]|nr:hypothetical protein B0H10DRAFT_1969389 [Mycena sp. CBHHK59/15]